MRGPTVSVAMAVYNGAPYLAAAIASIISQTHDELELIIVDDGSTDESRDIIRDAAAADSRVVPVFRRHGGIANATNAALALARGAYFAPMDQDDIALPARIACEKSYLDTHPDVLVVGSAWEDFGGAETRIITPPLSPRAVANAMHERCVVLHPVSMMRTEAIRRLGGYRAALPYGHDSDSLAPGPRMGRHGQRAGGAAPQTAASAPGHGAAPEGAAGADRRRRDRLYVPSLAEALRRGFRRRQRNADARRGRLLSPAPAQRRRAHAAHLQTPQPVHQVRPSGSGRAAERGEAAGPPTPRLSHPPGRPRRPRHRLPRALLHGGVLPHQPAPPERGGGSAEY